MPISIAPKTYTLVTGTAGTVAANYPHNLGTTPEFVLLTVTGSVAGVIRCVSRDQTNLSIISTLASTTFEAVCVA